MKYGFNPEMDKATCKMERVLQWYYEQLGGPRFFRAMVGWMVNFRGGIAFSNAKNQLLHRIDRLALWDLNKIDERDKYLY